MIIETFDFKVFQNFIMPIIKKLMDSSKADPFVRHAIAKNLAQIAKLGTRMLEVAIGSCNARREELARLKKEKEKKTGDEIHRQRLDMF